LKLGTWFFLLLTAGLLFAGGAAVLRNKNATPDMAFQDVQKQIAKGHSSVEEILEDLEDALKFAERAGDGGTATEIRRTRGRVLLDLGAHDQARRDFETVLDVTGGDYDIEGLLVELERRAGNLDAAIARVERRLEEDESEGEVWVQAAGVYVDSADHRLEECLESLARVLLTQDEARAAELLKRGAALDPADPLRVAVGHDLWQLFAADTDRKRQEALAAMDAASEDLRRARQAYARSLELAPAADAVAGLLEILARSQHHDETLDLGIASLPFGDVQENPETALILIRTLRESGHLSFAAEFASRWALGENIVINAGLYAECCRTLLENESWSPLVNAANRLGQTSDPRLVPHANLYRGIGLTHREDFTRARTFLTKWLDEGRAEPFEGATTLAWQNVAHCWAELDQSDLERLALERAVASGADFSGETWLRLAELQLEARHGGYRTPEERWARGMAESENVSDAMAADHFETWQEMGDRELETTAFDPEAEHRNMVRSEIWTPRPGLSPYELFRLAQAHEADGDNERALMTQQRLIEEIPGFPPAVDRAIELALDLGYEKDAAELLLLRMERTGRDAYAMEVLDALDHELLGQDDLLLLMRLDPEITGRKRLAESYDAANRPERARSVLGDLADEELDPELAWYGIELLTRIGRFDEVSELLDNMELEELQDPNRLATLVDAYVGARRDDRIRALVTHMLRSRTPPKGIWLDAVDRLLGGGYVDLARQLLAKLDETSEGGGDVLVRAAVTELLAGDIEAAFRFVIRAEAFPTDGQAELVHLLALIESGSFHDLRSAVSHIRLAEYSTSPNQDIALLLLEDDQPRARVAILDELEGRQHDPIWALLVTVLHARDGDQVEPPTYFGEEAAAEAEFLLNGQAAGSGDTLRDPRYLAGLLLALDDPIGALWVRGALSTLDPRGERMWPQYLIHASRTDPRDDDTVRAAMEQLTTSFPTFGPAWDRLDQLLIDGSGERDSTERIELRVRRRQALSDNVAPPAELALDEAREARLKKQMRRAEQKGREAVDADPQSLAAYRMLGELYVQHHNYEKAVAAYDAALLLTQSASDQTIVPEAIAVFRRAQLRGDLELQGYADRLVSLTASFPDDPIVPRARAELELVMDKRNPALGVARAYAHLDRFREDHQRVSLEDLRPGSAVNWGRFLLALDPERAEAFTREELLTKPGSLELWIFMGEILQAAGDAKAALKHMLIVHRMAPREGRVLRKLAELEALNGIGRIHLTRRVTQVREVEGLKNTDPELSYWRAMAIMGTGSRGIVGSLDRLSRVWRHRDELPPYLSLERVGLRYASALIARGGAPDRELAREVLDEFKETISAPYQRDLALGLYGLSLHDPAERKSTSSAQAR
jgi:tetratricopeptide (TPR) repeat protein